MANNKNALEVVRRGYTAGIIEGGTLRWSSYYFLVDVSVSCTVVEELVRVLFRLMGKREMAVIKWEKSVKNRKIQCVISYRCHYLM